MFFIPVAVIIPCFRCHLTLGRAINSIANQTYLPSEIILVEDFSNDDEKTCDAIRQSIIDNPDLNFRAVFLENNVGPGEARNIGWSQANGTYIAFLDADDCWAKTKLELQYNWMIEHSDVDLTGHHSMHLSQPSLPLAPQAVDKFTPISFNDLLISNLLPTRTVMLKKSIKERFPEKYQAEDYLLWLTIASHNKKITLLKEVLAYSFKRDFGEAGLGADLTGSFTGLLEVYRLLYEKKKISNTKYCLLLVMSYLKYFRRKFITSLLRMTNQKRLM
jgi:glycosyltransferase involved in cell wall biosynthesis